ncbi:hypothetical protein [Bradyrhizobium brasilense]|uniref:Uncharacterized protein n=1 Tax=Bradyrhizobium brasilense TaxID=1419277 RepID=A0ABY8JSN8_9BRAD|nr:hypothetical protein [Bradyrhizobium brasilense]WFU66732.1 hypothetical protein QA636_15010 [Bradyrhizobium brasilense]
MDFVRTISPFFLVYAIGVILTFGVFYREKSVRPGTKQIAAALAWPIWWPIANGFGATLDAVYNAVTATEGRKTFSWAVGLFAVGHCLSSSWNDCGGLVACTGVVAKSVAVFFPPLNFGYVIWLASRLV